MTIAEDERRRIIHLARQIGKHQTAFKRFLYELEKKKMPQGLRILILDDDAARHLAFGRQLVGNIVHHTHSAKAAIANLENNTLYDIVFLDHDLGAAKELEPSGPDTGYEVAEWLASHPDKRPKTIILHTFNPAGAKNMQALLPEARWLPGIWNQKSSDDT